MSETFGGWELLTRLGQNELGETSLALRRVDQRQAALKRLSSAVRADPSFYAQLKLELALAAQLAHPSAAAILEVGEIEGVAFVAAEFVDGLSVDQLMARAQASGDWPLSMDRAAALIRPVLEALSAAHALAPALLHRDLVPQKVRVTCEGRVVVTDFGLGRARLRAAVGEPLRRSTVCPEQAHGKAADARSEVFASGLMLFELVCGRLPALGTAAEVTARIAAGELDSPLAVNPKLDLAVVELLGRALAVRPEDRFGSAREFFEALAPWENGTSPELLGAWVTRLDAVKLAAVEALPVVEQAPAPVPGGPRSATGRRFQVAAAGVGLALMLGVGVLRYVEGDAPFCSRSAVLAPEGRPLELTSIPSGAQVFVDGLLQDRRTPLTLMIAKDELQDLVLKKQGFGVWKGHVSNTHKLRVTLVTGEIEEERYEGSRPGVKEKPLQDDPVPEVQRALEPAFVELPPREEVVFDAESPPVEILLTAAHSVNADVGSPFDFAPGTVAGVDEGAALSIWTQPKTFDDAAPQRRGMMRASANWPTSRGYRALDVFALSTTAGGLEAIDLSKPVTFVKGGAYHLFVPAESGDLPTGSLFAKVNGQSIPFKTANLLRIEKDDSFHVRVLAPSVVYRLRLSVVKGQSGPPPLVLMSMRPEKDLESIPTGPTQNSMRFDGQPIPSGQKLVTVGSHELRGARSVWFTLITAKGIVPAHARLSIKPASAKKLR